MDDAYKILNRALTIFQNDTEYIADFAERYMDFVIENNDETNTRQQFEVLLTRVPTERAVRLWDKFMSFEAAHGTAAMITKLEKRRVQANPDEDVYDLSTGLRRYQVHDLVPLSITEKKLIGMFSSFP